MKSLKTIVLPVLVVAMLLIGTACNPIITDEGDTTAGDSTATEPAKLVMATDATFAPYEYTTDAGTTGIDIDIANKIAAKLGLVLEIKNMAFNDIITAVQNNTADIGMAGLIADETSLASVDFTASYTTGTQVIIVKAESEIAGPADLPGKRIGVVQATAGSTYCISQFGQPAVTSFGTGTEAVAALLQSSVDAVVLDKVPAKALAQSNQNLEMLDAEYKVDNYAIAVNKDNTSLLQKINSALAELKASGEIEAIVNTYIKAE